jgi:hypothetical protein
MAVASRQVLEDKYKITIVGILLHIKFYYEIKLRSTVNIILLYKKEDFLLLALILMIPIKAL